MVTANNCKPLSVCITSIHSFLEEDGGGEERFLNNFYNYLIHEGVLVTIVSSAAISSKKKNVGFMIKPFKLPFIGLTPYLMIFSVVAAIKIVLMNKRYNFSLIHSMDTGYAGLAGLFSSKILDIPFIAHSHCKRSYLVSLTISTRQNFTKSFASLYEGFERSIDKVVSKSADVVFAVSSEIRIYINSLGVSLNKVIVNPVGLDLSSFKSQNGDRDAVCQEFGINADGFIIGYVGTLSKPKGVPILIKAFSLIQKNSDMNVHLLLVGDGGNREEIGNTVKALMIPNVSLPGFRKDVERFLAAMDVFVLPSFSEGCPYSLLEALAAGKAIVANNIPSIREIVEDEKDAILVNPGDPFKLEQAFLRLYFDKHLRLKLENNSRKKACMYERNTLFAKILNVYNRICKQF